MTAPAAAVTPERDIAIDMARRALPLAPIPLVISAIFWQVDGVISSAYALVLIVANFLAAAALMTWGARISLPFLMGAVLGGYVLRLAVITVAVLAVTGLSWFEPIPLGFTLIVAHLGLLIWETRFISGSLAYPGLKPRTEE